MPTALKKIAIPKARKLRRDMTDGEIRLWNELKEFRRLYGIHVRRQVPIGAYVADFAIHSARVVIEVDGHFHEEDQRKQSDQMRDQWLKDIGYKVIRIRTGELNESFDGCIELILRELELVN